MKPVKVTCLGTGDAFSSGGRLNAAYLVEAPDARVLMEAGPAVLAGLKRAGLNPVELDLVLISHLHGDHFAGLPFLMLDYLWQGAPRKRVIVAGPRGLRERAERLMSTMYPRLDLGGLDRMLRFAELEPERQVRLQGVELRTMRVPHTRRDVSLALRLTVAGRSIVFSGDSRWTDRLAAFSAGADLFLCECSYYGSGHGDSHLDYETIVRHRAGFDVGRLVLTHLGREVLPRASRLKLETARDGMIIRL